MRPEDLTIEDGLVRGRDNRSVSYGELIAGDRFAGIVADDVAVKDATPIPSSGKWSARRSAGQGDR